MMTTIHLPNPSDAELTDDQWLDGCRFHRDRLLAESDWTQLPDAPVNRQAWADYRQALRDFPATWTPGPIVEFPTPLA
jgi:hypothetical protein